LKRADETGPNAPPHHSPVEELACARGVEVAGVVAELWLILQARQELHAVLLPRRLHQPRKPAAGNQQQEKRDHLPGALVIEERGS
jgi:hypothetical protein